LRGRPATRRRRRRIGNVPEALFGQLRAQFLPPRLRETGIGLRPGEFDRHHLHPIARGLHQLRFELLSGHQQAR
jgi:hypothetical protein